MLSGNETITFVKLVKIVNVKSRTVPQRLVSMSTDSFQEQETAEEHIYDVETSPKTAATHSVQWYERPMSLLIGRTVLKKFRSTIIPDRKFFSEGVVI